MHGFQVIETDLNILRVHSVLHTCLVTLHVKCTDKSSGQFISPNFLYFWRLLTSWYLWEADLIHLCKSLQRSATVPFSSAVREGSCPAKTSLRYIVLKGIVYCFSIKEDWNIEGVLWSFIIQSSYKKKLINKKLEASIGR